MDIEGFSDPARTNPIRLHLHHTLTRLLTDLLADAGVTLDQYASSDTGDGLVISLAAQAPAERLLDPLIPHLADRLTTFNHQKPPPERMRLRVALHAGRVLADPEPLHGEAVIHTCRLLDSPAIRACLNVTEQPLAAIVSQTSYDDVVKQGYGQIDPSLWLPVVAEVKETRAPAWVHVPGDPVAPLRAKVMVTTGAAANDRSGRPVPRQLPARPSEFTGREQELARLRELLGAIEPGGHAVVITAIDGLGGIGKSTLAIEGARQLADQFPDGQLYLDLHGSTVGLDPLSPQQALSYLLRSLGADPSEIPTQVEEAAAHYRTLIANRRLLLVLDNARDAAQVRPLLPGHPGCAVLITSRDTLAFLEGVTRVPLEVLSEPEALELLGRLAGPNRVRAERDAAVRLVRLCGLLPLAIQIAGRRLATRSAWSLAGYAARLADEQQRLDQLHFGDKAVRSSFQISYQILGNHDPDAARVLRLLSLLDGSDIAVPTAAVLLDMPVEQVQATLEDLVDTSLLTAPAPDRYQFHDLVRVFAREHAMRQHPQSERTAALTRAFGFYATTAWHTLALLRPGDRRLATADPQWAEGGLRFEDAPAALAWLDAERANLLAAIRHAAGKEPAVPSDLAGQLTRALAGFFDVRGYWHDAIQANLTVLQLGRRTQDERLQAHSANDLGGAYWRLGRYSEALDHLQDSLGRFRKLGDRYGEATNLKDQGIVFERLGRYSEALEFSRASLRISRELGFRRGEGTSLNSIGTYYRRIGRYEEALGYLQDSLRICRELGHRQGEASRLNGLGVILERLGRHVEALDFYHASLRISRELGHRRGEGTSLYGLGIVYRRQVRYAHAVDCLQDSLGIRRELGDRHGQVEVLRNLGDVLREVDRTAEARSAWQEALTLCEELQIPEADEIRARLADLSG